MKENKFRVWCEFMFEGELVKEMAGPESWFLLTQTGKLMTYGPTDLLRPLGKEYKVAIPLFYTGMKDKDGIEAYEEDIVNCKLSPTQRYQGIIQFHDGRFFIQTFWYSFKPIGRWDLEERKLCGKSTTRLNIDCVEKIIGNKYENPELLEANK